MVELSNASKGNQTVIGSSARDSTGAFWWQREMDVRREAPGAQGEGQPSRSDGKLTARQRIDRLLDDGSFREIGVFAGSGTYHDDGGIEHFVPANVVAGWGAIDGRHVVVVAEDFTLRGGSSEATSPEKWQYVEHLATEYKMPLVRLVETAGGSIRLLDKNASTKIPGYANWRIDELLATVPVVSAALGACAGFGAFRVCASHFSVMPSEGSWVFAAGPPVVRTGTGEVVTKDELGGAAVHARGSGVVDNEALDEDDALLQLRRYLSYLPSSISELPPVVDGGDDPHRIDVALRSAVPEGRHRPYDMRAILGTVADRDSLFEVGRYNGSSIITAFGRINGLPVGFIANDPMVMSGALTAEACEKVIRFVDNADTFRIPLVSLVDQPGTLVGTVAERAGTVRRGVRMQMAIEQTRVPWISVFIRRSYGLAGSAYAPITRGVNWRVAWPSAQWGSIPIEGGIDAAFRREIQEADDPAAFRQELVDKYIPVESPFRTAEKFGVVDVIDPALTRSVLSDWALLARRVLPTLDEGAANTVRV